MQRAQRKGLMVKEMGQALELVRPLVIDMGEIDKDVTIVQARVAEEAKDMGLSR